MSSRKGVAAPVGFAAVQTSAQVSGSGASTVITVAATIVNNLVIVHVQTSGVTLRTVTSITDNVGNTYVVGSSLTNIVPNIRLYQGYGVQTIGGATSITVNFSSSAANVCGVDEFSGGKITNGTVFDTTQTGSSGPITDTSLSVSTLTPAATGELIVASLATSTAATFTAGTNYTLYNGSDSTKLRSQYNLNGIETETAPATVASSRFWLDYARAYIPL